MRVLGSSWLRLLCAATILVVCYLQSNATMAAPPPEQGSVSYTVFFPWSSATLSEQDQNVVAQAAQVFKTKPNATITVTGYSDTIGSPALNMSLSLRRANVVKGLLVKGGVPAGSIRAVSGGDASLLEGAPQMNEPKRRRVVITVGQH
jgi:outer membrane protein OmpA-like peptidoglycan-associated protein